MVRISVGLENVEDIIADLEQAFRYPRLRRDFIVLIEENVPNTFGYVNYTNIGVARRHTDVFLCIKVQAHVLIFMNFCEIY